MRKIVLFFLSWAMMSFTTLSKHEPAFINDFKSGEHLKYKVHYMGVTAGFASLDINSTYYNLKPHYHMVGNGWTSGVSKVFFKVTDRYETYIDNTSKLPSKFVRKINEGGYTKNKVLTFNQKDKKVRVQNIKHNTDKTYSVGNNVQDLLSSFYYFRTMDRNNLINGKSISMDIFMDEEVYKMKLKVLGREKVNTKFGKVNCIKIRPYVQSGRVFKENESLTIWVTNDKNLIPVLVKADLAVGALKAELITYKNIPESIDFE